MFYHILCRVSEAKKKNERIDDNKMIDSENVMITLNKILSNDILTNQFEPHDAIGVSANAQRTTQ